MRSSVPRILSICPSNSTHIVVDTHDLPGLVRFWTQALGWKVLSERENEIVIGTGENASPDTNDEAELAIATNVGYIQISA